MGKVKRGGNEEEEEEWCGITEVEESFFEDLEVMEKWLNGYLVSKESRGYFTILSIYPPIHTSV